MALMIIAFLVLRHRVVIQVAIALGASVHPLTKITDSVSSADIESIGELTTSEMK